MSDAEAQYEYRGSALAAADIKAYLRQHEEKDLLRLLTCGSVDDGKSTLIGRLLYDTKMIYEDQRAAVIKDSATHGTTDTAFDPALLTDGLRAEREQGITIDVAYRYFSTDRRKFIIADTPGHEQYTRNMATGASTCNLAVILIDARHGVLPQTRRHSFISSLLGIRHFVVAVNKMDLVDYSQSRFDEIRREYEGFVAKLDVGDIHFIPMSAVLGRNVVDHADEMPWYNGAPILEYLETVPIAADRNLIDFRFPVQNVLRPNLDFRGYCGTVASGVVRPGDDIMVLPSGRRTRVKTIESFDGELAEAFPPLSVTLTVADEIDISRGNMLCHVNNAPTVGREFDAHVVWMHETPLAAGKSYLLKSTTNTVPAVIDSVRYRFDINTLHRQNAGGLELNEIGRVAVTVHRPLPYDSYARNRGTGGFVLVDRVTNATVGAGMILDRHPASQSVDEERVERIRSTNVHRHGGTVTAAARTKRLGHQACTVWLTGLPKSGKSTIAYALEQTLFDMGCAVHVLDGDNMRLGVSRDLGFGATDRAENVRRAAGIARICNDAGLITIAAFVSPLKADRERAKEQIGAGRFVEVHVCAPLDVCEARDTEGLYARARKGEIADFSGVTAPYEPPDEADLLLPSNEMTVDRAVARVVNALKQRDVFSC